MPRILISGINGFVGSQLARRKAEQGWDVIGLDVVSPDAAYRLQARGLVSVEPSAAAVNSHAVAHYFVRLTAKEVR